MELHTSLGKKLKLAAALALAATLLLSGAGCAKDVNPPVIQQTNMPEWAVEGEYIDLSVRTADDRGVQGAYIQFGAGDKIPLARTDSQKNGEEIANWEISLNLAPSDYTYRIVARDRANEVSKEGKITVYSKNSVHGYASNKNISMYLPQLLSLEDDDVVDNNEKAFIDLVAKYPKAGELVPGIYAELLLLPDLSIEKYSKIDEKDLGAVEKILSLASDPQYKTAFDTMLSTGIPDGRKYCSPLEALLWEAYDYKNLYGLLKPFSLEKLIKDAWTNTSASGDYGQNRWGDFDEVVARLNFPEGAYWYLQDNMRFEVDLGQTKDPKDLFYKYRKVGDCDDYTSFFERCLVTGGGYALDKFEKNTETIYPDYNFEPNETNAVCPLFTFVGLSSSGSFTNAHSVPLVKRDGQIYCFDATPVASTNRGPFKNINDFLDADLSGWTVSLIMGDPFYKVEGIIQSKSFMEALKNKPFRDTLNKALDFAFFNVKGKESNRWINEYLDNYGK